MKNNIVIVKVVIMRRMARILTADEIVRDSCHSLMTGPKVLLLINH